MAASLTLWDTGPEEALQQPWVGTTGGRQSLRVRARQVWTGPALGAMVDMPLLSLLPLPVTWSTGAGPLQASPSGSTGPWVFHKTRGLGLCRERKRPGQGPVVAPTQTSTFVSRGSTLNWTTGSAGGASHAAGGGVGGGDRMLAHPGHPKSPGGTHLCGSHQRSLSPVTPVSGRGSSGGECSVWQIRG